MASIEAFWLNGWAAGTVTVTVASSTVVTGTTTRSGTASVAVVSAATGSGGNFPPFGSVSAFYFPISTNSGPSQWGTDVRKLLLAAETTSTPTTTTQHGTGGVVTRTWRPYTSGTTDADETAYGWAVLPANMHSVAGALRYIGAGDHVFTGWMGHSGTVAETGTVTIFVYRVSSAATGRARTLLGSASVSVTFPINAGATVATLTVALPEIVFAPDETIQYSFETSLSGIAVVGHSTFMHMGFTIGVATRVNHPGLRVLITGSAVTPVASSTTATGKKAVAGTATGNGSSSTVVVGRKQATGTGTTTGAGSTTAVGGKPPSGSAVVTGAANTTATGTSNRFGIAVVTAASSTVAIEAVPVVPAPTSGGFWGRALFPRRRDKAKPEPVLDPPKHARGEAHVWVISTVTAEGYVRYPRRPKKPWVQRVFAKPEVKLQPITLGGAVTLMPPSRSQIRQARVQKEDELLLLDVL